jgi:hypothetical protein
MKRIAFLAGTSGLIGKQLLHQLIQDPSYDCIISVGRRKLALKNEKLIQISVDFNSLQKVDLLDKLREDDLGGDNFSLIQTIQQQKAEMHGFCTLGTTIKAAGSKKKFYEVDHDYVINFAKWIKNIGVQKFLYVSAMGSDEQSRVYYNKVKGEVESDLKSIGFPYLGLFQPSLLLGQRSEFRFGEEVAKVLTKPLVWLKLFKKFRPIKDFQVAKAMVFHAKNAHATKLEIVSSGQMQDF